LQALNATVRDLDGSSSFYKALQANDLLERLDKPDATAAKSYPYNVFAYTNKVSVIVADLGRLT
jgi:hypothetical protein